VTESTKGGGLRESEKTSEDDKKNNDAKHKEDLDRFEMSLSAPSRLIEKINPKDLDQMIKIFYSSHRKASTQSLILQPFKIISRVTPPRSRLLLRKLRGPEEMGLKIGNGLNG
jgi:hypothetical protein